LLNKHFVVLIRKPFPFSQRLCWGVPAFISFRSEAYFSFNCMQPLSEELDHSPILFMNFIIFESFDGSMNQDPSKKSSDKVLVDVRAGPLIVSTVPSKKTSSISRYSLIRSQNDVDAILQDFNITGVEAVLPSQTDTINRPPKGFFAYTSIHIWHGGFLPFPAFLHNFLRHLGIAPIQLSPNMYTYLLALETLSLESGGSSLDPITLFHLVCLAKTEDSCSLIYRTNPGKKLIFDRINKFKD